MVDTGASSDQLRGLARLLIESWNRGDAQAFAGLFTPEAEYATGTSERVRGRQAIAGLVQQASRPQVCLVGDPDVGCDSSNGQLSFAWSAVAELGATRHGRISCACIRQGSRWLIEALQNVEDGSVVLEQFELAPDGEEPVCMGFHFWTDGDFRV